MKTLVGFGPLQVGRNFRVLDLFAVVLWLRTKSLHLPPDVVTRTLAFFRPNVVRKTAC